MHQRKNKRNEEHLSGKSTHEEHSKRGVRVAQNVWPRIDDAKEIESVIDTFSKDSVSKSLEAARASQKQEKSGIESVDDTVDATVTSYASCKAGDIRKWLKDIRHRQVDGRKVLNCKQYQVVLKVANRVIKEINAASGRSKDTFESIGEPLRWCVHGGPGTGKSHVIKIMKHELFKHFAVEYECRISNCRIPSCYG